MDVERMLLIGTFSILLLGVVAKRTANRRTRRFRIRPINRSRKEKSQYEYFKKIKENDPEQFFKFTRMTVPMFNELLSLIENKIKKRKIADGVSPEERLGITLQYLSQGGSMQSLAWAFQMGLSTISQILEIVCEAICASLIPVYLKEPTLEEYLAISDSFFHKWNFPNTIGAIDGKHVTIQAPAHSGSQFFNYKKSFSIVLLAVCDADYIFRLVDIGSYGSQSDGGIFKNSIFGKKFENGQMPIPKPQNIPKTSIKMPFVLVGDQAFPLKKYLFKPYSSKSLTSLNMRQRIFNYRLSRCRRVIENAFGILVARWRLLRQTIIASPEHVDIFVKTCVVLHNFCKIKLADNAQMSYCPPSFVDTGDEDNGQWRTEVQNLQSVGRTGANNAARDVFILRDTLSHYFITEGQVPWQNERISMGEHVAFPRNY